EGGECAVVEGARGVDDSGDGVVVGYVGEQGGQGVRVGGVGRDDGRGGVELGQSGGEFRRGGRVRARAAGEEEVSVAVVFGEVQGGESGQEAGAAGDEGGAVGVGLPGECEGEFAGVAGLAEVPQRLRGAGDRVRRRGQRGQGPALEE